LNGKLQSEESGAKKPEKRGASEESSSVNKIGKQKKKLISGEQKEKTLLAPPRGVKIDGRKKGLGSGRYLRCRLRTAKLVTSKELRQHYYLDGGQDREGVKHVEGEMGLGQKEV